MCFAAVAPRTLTPLQLFGWAMSFKRACQFDFRYFFQVDVDKDVYFEKYLYVHEPSEPEEIYFIVDSTKLLYSLAGVQRATHYFKIRLSKTTFECFVIE